MTSDDSMNVSVVLRTAADDIDAHNAADRDVIFTSEWFRDLADRIDDEMVELPKDADGVPIHVGDTVYLDDGRNAKVARIQLSERENSIGFTLCGDFFALWPEDLTHTRPDSLERIADELEELSESNRINGSGEVFYRTADLAARIRRLADKEGK